MLDPFAGSGTTLEAALRLGRHGVGIELSPAYCALAVERIEPVARQELLFEPHEIAAETPAPADLTLFDFDAA